MIEVSACRVLLLIAFLLGMTGPVGYAASTPFMRPYTGVGLLVFSHSDQARDEEQNIPLYEEPGLSRVGTLISSRLSGNEAVFSQYERNTPLIVSACKGEWLRVFYDDAGREAWIDPRNYGRFQTWEQFLKLQTGRMLPALQSQYYQFLQQPGGKQLAVLTPKQVFKVLKLDNGWAMVLSEGRIGWVRWRDDDGRLTVGTGRK